MHHPQPQHPLSTRRYLRTEFLDNHQPYRASTSNVRSSQSLLPGEEQQAQAIVGAPQYAMSVHPPMPPQTSLRSPEIQHGFQMSPNRHQAEPPIFALRPVNAPMAFSHIEYPNMPSEQTRPSDSYGAKPHESVATAYRHSHSRDQPHHSRQLSYESSEMESPDPQPQRQQTYYHSPEHPRNSSTAYNYAPEPMGRQETLKTIVRRRARGDSNSSAASIWSSAAASGEAAYRNDMLQDEAKHGSYNISSRPRPIPPNSTFQPRSAPTSYPYEYAPAPRDGTFPVPESVDSNFLSSPAMEVDSPCIPAAPRPSELALGDPEHPFTSGTAIWDIPFSAASAASTDGDAFSLHSQEQQSSRGSSEPSSGPTRQSRRGKNDGANVGYAAASERREASNEGKKKTVMACHFCRFRKLRCDGGHPCAHCQHREKECTYDAKVRRRGPGRKNKSAQETALVQLANRQREEAEREASVQTSIGRGGTTKERSDFRDASSQTSPQPKRYVSGSRDDFDTPQYQLRMPQDATSYPQAYQTFPIPSSNSYEREPEASRYAQEWEEHDMPPMPSVRQSVDDHRRVISGPVTYGLQAPVTQAPSSFYDSSPGRFSSQQRQGHYASNGGYEYNLTSNRYSIATQDGETTYSHTDSESAYAYSEGANVMPSGYSYERHNPPDSRHHHQPGQSVNFGRVTASENSAHMGEAGIDTGRMVNYDGGRTRVERREMRH